MHLPISVTQMDHLTKYLTMQKVLLCSLTPRSSTAFCPYCTVYLFFHTAVSILCLCMQLCVCMQRADVDVSCPALSASAWLRQSLHSTGFAGGAHGSWLTAHGSQLTAHSSQPCAWLFNMCAGPYSGTTDALIHANCCASFYFQVRHTNQGLYP